MRNPRSRALTISDRAYRALLRIYPAAFRSRFEQEMAQVFRSACRDAYNASGAGGVLRLWLPTLWDWIGSLVDEWLSNPFNRSKMYHIHARRASSQLIPMLLLMSSCLLCLFISPFSCWFWLFGGSFLGENEICQLDIDNQSGNTLRVTPMDVSGNPISAIRLYRRTFPFFHAYLQRNISVKSGEVVSLSYDCSRHNVSVLYACDLEEICYLVNKRFQTIASGPNDHGYALLHGRITIASLEGFSHPDDALEAAVRSFPEHDYSGMGNILLCFIAITTLIGGFYGLVRASTVAMPKSDL